MTATSPEPTYLWRGAASIERVKPTVQKWLHLGRAHHAHAATSPLFRCTRAVGPVYRGYAPLGDTGANPGEAPFRGTDADHADCLGPCGDALYRHAAGSSRRLAACPGRPVPHIEAGRTPGGRAALRPGAAARGAL